MSGRPPLPWWKRKQATLIAEAARRAGLTATARLEGWLEIRDTDGKEVAEAKFNQDSGQILHASGRTADTGRGVSFRRDAVAYFTAREVVDGYVAWLAGGRLAASDAAGVVREQRAESIREQINRAMFPDGKDTRPDATVSDFTTRKRRT